MTKSLSIPLLIPLILLSACTPKQWNYSDVVAYSPEFDSALLQFKPENKQIGVGVELLTGAFGTYGYLNVEARTIPPLPGSADAAVVVFVIDEEKFPYKGCLMEGRQKILLPQEATDHLLSALNQEEAVTIYLDGFMTKLEPSNFTKLSKKFTRLDPKNPKPSEHLLKARPETQQKTASR